MKDTKKKQPNELNPTEEITAVKASQAVKETEEIKETKLNHSLFAIGTGIITGMFAIQLISVIVLVLKLNLGGWIAIAGGLVGLGCTLFYSLYFGKLKALQTGVVIAVLILSTLGSFFGGSFLYDNSWDGQSYQGNAMRAIHEGWNPIYSELETNDTFPNSKFANAYAKGAWYDTVSIWNLTNKAQSGKMFNLLLIIASLVLIFAAINTLWRNKKIWLAAIVAGVAAFNPVSVIESPSYYTDGQLASLILILLSFFVLYYFKPSWQNMVMIVLTSVLIINTKLTAIAYLAVLGVGFLIALFAAKKINIMKEFKMYLIAGFSLAALAIGVVGYSPFVTNTIYHHNPLYLVIGEGNISLKETNVPKNFRYKNNLKILVASVFFRGDTGRDTPWTVGDAKFKLPFQIFQTEFHYLTSTNTVGGFGPWFSGGVVLMLLLLGYWLYLVNFTDPDKSKDGLKHYGAYIFAMVVLIASVLINYAPSVARYVPQLWFVIPLTLIYGFVVKNRVSQVFTYALLGVSIVNLGIIAYFNMSYSIQTSADIDNKLASLQASSQKKPVYVELNRMPFVEVMLQEYGIKYQVVDDIHTVCKNYKYQYIPRNEASFCMDNQ